MRKAPLILSLLILAVVVVGAVVAGTLDIPAPERTVEKVVPNDRFK